MNFISLQNKYLEQKEYFLFVNDKRIHKEKLCPVDITKDFSSSDV